MSPGYYYFGGYDMDAKEITVLMVEPGKHPKVTTLKDDLDSLQKAVSIGADYQGLRLLDTHEFARLAKTVFGDRVGEMSAEVFFAIGNTSGKDCCLVN